MNKGNLARTSACPPKRDRTVVTVSRGFAVTVPKHLRGPLKVRPGQVYNVTCSDRTIYLTSVDEPECRAAERDATASPCDDGDD